MVDRQIWINLSQYDATKLYLYANKQNIENNPNNFVLKQNNKFKYINDTIIEAL